MIEKEKTLGLKSLMFVKAVCSVLCSTLINMHTAKLRLILLFIIPFNKLTLFLCICTIIDNKICHNVILSKLMWIHKLQGFIQHLMSI